MTCKQRAWQQQTIQTLGILLLAAATAIAQISAGGNAVAQPSSTPSTISTSAAASGVQSQSPFQGSVPTGKATGTVMPLSILEAIDRGLKYNLGLIESDLASRTARAERLRALSALLPDVNAKVDANTQQTNLKALGINFPGAPTVVGPFSFDDARANISQRVFDWSALKNLQASVETLKASELSYKSSRDLVVLATGNAYLVVIADQALVDSVRAQVRTADALYQRAADQRKAGVVAAIDELRAKVELQTQQQRLIVQENQLAKDKLNLARIIGLPTGQEFTLTDKVPFQPLAGLNLERELERAYTYRPDYQAAKADLRSAELARKAAVAERYPTLSVKGDYGDIGPNFAQSHGTFTFAATVNVPIYTGGRIKAGILQADAKMKQRQAELENLRGKIDYDVRTAFLDLKAAADQVAVAQSNIDLANQTLTQAQDRFAAGVSDNLEVVQAQETVAASDQAYISSLYAHNLAKVSLARAVGVAEQAVRQFLGGK